MFLRSVDGLYGSKAPPARPTDTDTAQNQNQNPGATSAGNPANANANGNTGAATKDTASASLTAVSTDASAQTQGALSNTASGLSGTGTASSVSPTLPTFTSGSGTDTQTQTQANVGLGAVSAVSSASASSTPSPLGSASSGSNSNTSFFANKPTVIGIFTAAGLVLAIFLFYVLIHLLTARKRRRLDREMDDAFRETMESAQGGWRVMAGLEHGHGEGAGWGVQRTPSISSVASAGSLSYTQPPLAIAPQASYYNYGYEPGYAPEPAYAPAPVGMMGMGMGQMAQHAYSAQTYAHDGLARPGASQGDYLSNYTHPHPHALPNPFDGGERAMPMPMMEVPLPPGPGLGVQGRAEGA
ncbi:hypothetical protein B0H13DRAFT_2522037 [Mycena leptocephala]|nr:hypothetical protein B0H13DRAFT_2522037 [Mycena leptocephala]